MSNSIPDGACELLPLPDHAGVIESPRLTFPLLREATMADPPRTASACPTDAPSIRVDEAWLKRSFDIVGAVLGLLCSAPLMAVCALAIKIQDGGPVLFSQPRVGRGGRTFRIYKFRTMVVNADALKSDLLEENRHDDNRTFKILNDPRITRFGRHMRRMSLDELPQFWNVLTGQMSLVGPRPAVPAEVELYGQRDWERLAVKPGLTCIWQVSGRSNLGFEKQMDLDLQYIRTRGLWTDLKLILRTLPAVIRGDGAA